MRKKIKSFYSKGFSILEVILSVAIFSIFSTASVVFFMSALSSDQKSLQYEVASFYASEGLEAVRAIRDETFDNLNDTDTSGLEFSNDKWQLAGDSDSFDIYERTISISTVSRDGDGDIISDGGTNDPDMKKIVSTVNWTDSAGQTVSIQMETYLSRWK